MARKIKLTDARIGKLKAGDVEYMVWDTRIAGFGVRVRPSGHKSYVYHRHAEGQSRKFTLGPVALGSVDEARRDCMEVWGRMQSGERAEGSERRAGSTVPGGTRRCELGSACVPADHGTTRLSGIHRDQPDPGPKEESAPQAHQIPVARGNRPSP